MNEQQWEECRNPDQMLEFLGDKTSERKLRLFACACCRRIWHLLPRCVMIGEEEREVCRHALVTAESYADGQAAQDDLARMPPNPLAIYSAPAAFMAAAGQPLDVGEVIRDAAEAASRDQDDAQDRWYEAEQQAQCRLLRCLFGNPFRPVSVDPAWLTSSVLAVAQAAYDQRDLPAGNLDPIQLNILADALEDAGCTDSLLLGHLRGHGPHALGCWALDLALGKE